MSNIIRVLYFILSFTIPLIGVAFYIVNGKKKESTVYASVGVIGIFVYMVIGIVFL